MAVAELPCPIELETMEVTVMELLAQYEKMVVTEVLVDQKEWQVNGPWVMMLVFDLNVYAASVVISAHIRKFRAGSTI
jgi:hypothetical protein